ncbi:MAG: PAS domain S-box protein [Balneolales bacterium]|nr:PAS domain S-box protein [Balneolales bacterium]
MSYTFPVIGIGASAGGLEPLESFFEAAPVNKQCTYIIIQHLAPNHKSLMHELLSRHTKLPIHIIEDGMELEAGNIYLNPPKKFVELRNRRFSLLEKIDRKLSFPISSFLVSLAEEAQEYSCAIILSGTGSDGSEGIKSIKEVGGLVLAQDPETARFNGMPKNAIYTGSVDKAVRIEQMHYEISSFFSSEKSLPEKSDEENHALVIDKILQLVKLNTNIDFYGYKRTTVSRRILRRTGILGRENVESYHAYLKENPDECHLLSKELLIGVTRFFRDATAFDALNEQVIPKLVEQNEDTRTIRVWVPACSTGEEAYSIALLLKNYLRKQKKTFEVSIFATDLDKEAIKTATNRIFSESIANEIPSDLLSTYFIPQRKGFIIHKDIRDMIVFSAHNLVQDPPFNRIDLISCRNMLIYMDNTLQQYVFSVFQYSLKTGGFLFLGSSETPGKSQDKFSELDARNKIYINLNNQKLLSKLRDSNRRPYIGQKTTQPNGDHYFTNELDNNQNQNPKRTIHEIQHALIMDFVPDSIIYNENMDLMHTTGDAGRWLMLPAGEFTTQVHRMLPENLVLPFEIATQKVLNNGKEVRLSGIKPPPGIPGVSDITVKLYSLSMNQRVLAAFFSTSRQKSFGNEPEELQLDSATSEKIHILEQELRISRENLQSTIEELESSNEELQAANEELQSSNEELESVNEELYTVNSELQQKIQDLSDLNSDLNNLIQSTDIALLFLDSSFNIRRYTPAIKRILDLVPHDIGRNISHYRGNLQIENFMGLIDQVYQSLIPYKATIKDGKGKTYIIKIIPYKTSQANEDATGIIIVFLDVTLVSDMQNELRISNKTMMQISESETEEKELFELIVNQSRDMIQLLSVDGTILYTSPSCAELTGFEVNELKGTKYLSLVNGKKARVKWSGHFLTVLNNHYVGLHQYRLSTKKNGTKWVETSLRPLYDSKGKVHQILATTRNIHERIQREQNLQKLSLIAEQTSNGVVITDKKGLITFVNEAFEKITGYMQEEVLGRKPGSFLQGDETDPETVRYMGEHLENQKPFITEVINYTKNGDKYWVKIQAEPLYDKNDAFIGYFSIQNDISVEKEFQERIFRLNEIIRKQNVRLEEINKSLEEFAYVASHDLKTPVRNIRGMVDILNRKGDTMSAEKKQEVLHIISNAAAELGKLIDNLLEYSRTGRLEEEASEVSFPEICASVTKLFDKDIEETNGQLRTNLQVEKGIVYPILFKRMLTNLVNNAVKYHGHKPPEIEIENYMKGSQLHFRITDKGIGIPENQQERIFKIFHIYDKEKGGNGIGLAVCKKIAELHRGSISVSSKIGEGSSFVVTLGL